MSERRLIEAARHGSSSALGQLFDAHWTAVWRVAYAVTRRRDLADEVAQDAFLRFLSTIDRFDPRQPVRPWLSKIATNRAIDVVRAEERSRPRADVVEEHYRDPDLPDTELGTALMRLPAEARALVVLHYQFDFTQAELAEMFDLPRGTVASRVSRALAALRAELEADSHV